MKLLILVVVMVVFVATSLALKNEICGLPHSYYRIRCLASMSRWSYDHAKNECVHFYYGGCGGNENKFYSLDECIQTCVE